MPAITPFETSLASVTHDIKTCFSGLLPQTSHGTSLANSMRYATLEGGKGIRGFLVVTIADLFHVPREYSLRTACAVEAIHAYSLVHDDLPCLDNDHLRRGKPTTHIQFGEDVALLCGDALQTLAFEILSDKQTHHSAEIRCKLIGTLATASGWDGMVGGQMLDMLADNTKSYTEDSILQIQNRKTGALLKAACIMGCILGEETTEQMQALANYGDSIGLAFQIQDDLLDKLSTVEELGKATKKDKKYGKESFVDLWGIEGAQQKANACIENGLSSLKTLPFNTEGLYDLAKFVIKRTS